MNPLIIFDWKKWRPTEEIIYILGSFETLHKGHLKLLQKALNLRNKTGYKIALVYFTNESLSYKTNEIFTDDFAKEFVISTTEIDYAISIEFLDVKPMSGDEFLEILTNGQESILVAGSDFKFGKGKKDTLKTVNLPNIKNIYEVPLLKDSEVKIGTSILRDYISEGKISDLNEYLVQNYCFSFKYISQKLSIDEKLKKLHPGIYYSFVFEESSPSEYILHVDRNLEYHLHTYEKGGKVDFDPEKRYVLVIEKEIRLIYSNEKDFLIEEDYFAEKNI
ncbi:FAD synthase [Mycoplasma sp. Ms02]|uniref:FAD synthase n=1 Tax=Mycoplasma sp. Ms02 TaxID=353851 RepID=UPI001C8A7D00|nr:hypothetical protein [Mycoplasma sp. Ms02]QZE12091.1 hypothetical protein K4L35_01895 [Mycoplasma sp. Ms02]